jgi:hypothetical protein
MATLSATLSLASTDVSSDALSLTAAVDLTVTDPFVGVSKIAATTTGNETIVLASHCSNYNVRS